jgi:OOP family OmpA-OmpF porin
LVAVTTLGAGSALLAGCHAQAEAKIGGTEQPPPPPPAPPAPPATAAAPPPPPPAPKVVTLRGVQMKSATQIDMPGDIEYQTGSAAIVMNDKSKKVLTQLVTIMKDNPEISKLRIEGNTDNAGEKKGYNNVKLSQERAQSVADYLTKNGIDATRLAVVGYGSTHGIAANDTPEHMALNRRTDFHVQEFNGQAIDDGGAAAQAAAAAAAANPAKEKEAAKTSGKESKEGKEKEASAKAPTKPAAPAAGAPAAPKK